MNELIPDEQIPGKMRRAYKAQVARQILSKQKDFFGKLSPSQKDDFFYQVYIYLDKKRDRSKEPPIFRPGLPKLVASKKVYRINELGVMGGFDISLFKLFERMYKAMQAVEHEMILAPLEKEIEGE